MYKTIIFIINSYGGYINKYDPDLLSQLADKRLVVVINEKMTSSLSDEQRKFFSKIYEISECENSLYPKGLSEVQLEVILKKELAHLSNTRELLIISHNESCVDLAAKMREKFKISGMIPALANLFTNKVMMKSKLNGSHIRIPRYIDFTNAPQEKFIRCYEYIKEKTGVVFIVKPICGAGSFGVEKISNLNEFISFLKNKKNDLLKFYAEEYINGELYHCDSIVKDHKIIKTLCLKYNFPMLEFMRGNNVGSFTFMEDSNVMSRLRELNADILSIFGANDGIYHTEIFLEEPSGDLVFLESAARSPGGCIIQVYNKTYNINLLNLDLQLHLGDQIDLSASTPQVHCFWAYIPPVTGTVKHIFQPKLNSNHLVKWQIKKGDALSPPKSLKDRIGELIVWNSNYNELMQDLYYVSNSKFIEVE